MEPRKVPKVGSESDPTTASEASKHSMSLWVRRRGRFLSPVRQRTRTKPSVFFTLRAIPVLIRMMQKSCDMQAVIPSAALSFRAHPCHSGRTPVIPSAALSFRAQPCHSGRSEESHKVVLGMPYEILHSAPLRSE